MTRSSTADHLREISQWMQEVLDETTRRVQAIEVKYGAYFRTHDFFSGEYYNPYLYWVAAPRRIAKIQRLQREAVALSAKFDRLARKAPRGRRTDPAVSFEHGDVARLLAALGDRDPNTRRLAATLLGRLKASAAVGPLLELLDNPEVAEEAVRALGAIGDRRAVRKVALVVERADLKPAASAVVALGDIGGPEAVDLLVPRLDSSFIGGLAARSLGKIGDPRALEPLREALARCRAESPGDDAGRRLQQLHCRILHDAIREIADQ
jgi:hypothetical protein